MGRVWATTAGLAGLLGVASSGLAQSGVDQPPPLPSRNIPVYTERLPIAASPFDPDSAELKRWMDDFTEWKKWWAEFANRREQGLFSGHRERREKPVPPAWLPDRCQTILGDADPLLPACALLAEWNEDVVTAQQRQARAAATAKKEDTSKTIWWEHVHMDVLWPATQWQTSVYGVVGMHTTTTVRGRLQVFIAPGVMLLNLPTRNGTRGWKIAANYGIGYRLFDFRFLRGRQAVLHVNLARAWIVSDSSDLVTGKRMDFAGFSLTFKKAR
jgi:hypothetical protein